MKKRMVILVVILSVAVFGTVSSARAFIDPLSLSIVLGTAMIVLVIGAELHYAKEEKQALKGERVTVQFTDERQTEDMGRPLSKD